MTTPETPDASPATGKRSPAVIAAIVIVVVIALVGGAFLVYKLTKSKDEPKAAIIVAKDVTAAVASGDKTTIRSLSTGEGTSQLLVLKPASVSGIQIRARDCKTFGGKTPTRVCTATRPGGQVALRLIFTDGQWKVDLATVGPAALPPTSTTTTT